MITCQHGYLIGEGLPECPACRAELEVAEPETKHQRQTVIEEHIADVISNPPGVTEPLEQEQESLARLRKDPAILDNFIKRQNFYWDHQAWLDLLEELGRAGYTPFDPDQVGLLLEGRREYLRQK